MRMCQRWCILLFVCIIEMFAQPEQTLKNFYCCPVKCVLLPMLLKFCIENKRANYSPPYFLHFSSSTSTSPAIYPRFGPLA